MVSKTYKTPFPAMKLKFNQHLVSVGALYPSLKNGRNYFGAGQPPPYTHAKVYGILTDAHDSRWE